MADNEQRAPIQPVSGTIVPRFAGPSTFARLPELRDVARCDVAILGVPFDSGTSYRPGARFGPQGIRQASRHLRTPYHPAYDTEPFLVQQVADAGDVACNPFNITEAVTQIETAATALLEKVDGLVSMGGDHTIALPLLRAVNHRAGPVALVHFDAHLDTWDTYFGAPYTHGTPFRRAAEEGLFVDAGSMHVGTRLTEKTKSPPNMLWPNLRMAASLTVESRSRTVVANPRTASSQVSRFSCRPIGFCSTAAAMRSGASSHSVRQKVAPMQPPMTWKRRWPRWSMRAR